MFEVCRWARFQIQRRSSPRLTAKNPPKPNSRPCRSTRSAPRRHWPSRTGWKPWPRRAAAEHTPDALCKAADRLMGLVPPGADFPHADRPRRRHLIIGNQHVDGISAISGIWIPKPAPRGCGADQMGRAWDVQVVTAAGTLLSMPTVIKLASHAYHFHAIFDKHTGRTLDLGQNPPHRRPRR